MNISDNNIFDREHLPKDWNTAPLGDTCEIFSGYAFKSSDFANSGVPIIKIGNLQNGVVNIGSKTSYLPESKYNGSLAKYVLHKGDVLIAMTGATTGKMAVVPESAEGALLNQRVGKIEVTNNEMMDLMYARYYFETLYFQNQIQNGILKSAQGNISPKNIKNISISFPPLPEQKAIAHVLRTVQAAKKATEKVIAATKELKKSMMKHLFTYGPVAISQLNKVSLKETDIGVTSDKWILKELKDISKIVVSTASVNKINTSNDNNKPEKIMFLKVSDLNNPLNIPRITTAASIYTINQSDLNDISYIPANSIIFPKRGAAIATNKKRHTTSPCLLDPNLMAVVPNNEINSNFLFYWFEQLDLRKITDDATLPQINKKDVEPLKVPCPPLEEQISIVNLLNVIDIKIKVESAKYNVHTSLFNSLLHNLMTGKVRVNELKGVN